jgi:hypothetical protein
VVIFFSKYLLGPVYASQFGYMLLLSGERKKVHEICYVSGSAVHDAVFGLQSCLG